LEGWAVRPRPGKSYKKKRKENSSNLIQTAGGSNWRRGGKANNSRKEGISWDERRKRKVTIRKAKFYDIRGKTKPKEDHLSSQTTKKVVPIYYRTGGRKPHLATEPRC